MPLEISSVSYRFFELPNPLMLFQLVASCYSFRYLREQIAVPEAKVATRMIPDTPPSDGIFVVDTAEMFSALEGHSGERRNLERMCRLLGMRDLAYMHNAGNDAHVRNKHLVILSSYPVLHITPVDGAGVYNLSA